MSQLWPGQIYAVFYMPLLTEVGIEPQHQSENDCIHTGLVTNTTMFTILYLPYQLLSCGDNFYDRWNYKT